MTRIRYMGNKHSLAPAVLEIAEGRPQPGPLIDVFCGMCSIGQAFASSRRSVWGNDVQEYAALAARCHLSSREPPLRSPALARLLISDFRENTTSLKKRFSDDIGREDRILASGTLGAYSHFHDEWRHAANCSAVADEVASLQRHPTGPSRLFTLSYSVGYFGLRQAIAIDSIRHALDTAKRADRVTAEQFEWALLALVEAASVCGSTPGHFAQYLRGATQSGFDRIRRQRARSVWEEFLVSADAQEAFGSYNWRSGNGVSVSDALSVWRTLDSITTQPAIVYADPPYSKDHYSRYYHVLETLVLYDYPVVSGVGRYRPDRFTTPFSLKRSAHSSFRSLFSSIAERGWSLILSYPNNGVVPVEGVSELLCESFSSARLALRRPMAHSTMGSRHGNAKNAVEELMWVAG